MWSIVLDEIQSGVAHICLSVRLPVVPSLCLQQPFCAPFWCLPLAIRVGMSHSESNSGSASASACAIRRPFPVAVMPVNRRATVIISDATNDVNTGGGGSGEHPDITQTKVKIETEATTRDINAGDTSVSSPMSSASASVSVPTVVSRPLSPSVALSLAPSPSVSPPPAKPDHHTNTHSHNAACAPTNTRSPPPQATKASKQLRSYSASSSSSLAASSSIAVPALASPVHTPFLSGRVLTHRQRVRLGKTFTEFQVRVVSPSLHWEVWRRYSEFSLFHRELEHEANLREKKKEIPKLPPSKLVGNLKDGFVEKRRLALDTYLQTVLNVEAFNTCMPVLSFLGALENVVGGSRHTSSKKGKHSSTHPSPSHLHLDAVLSLLDAGDIVLFRTTGVLQGLQRTFTGSKYDHVGVVIRIPWSSVKASSLHLLEATSDGVRTYNLSRRLRAWFLSNATIAVRQLKNVKRTNTFLSALDAFVSDVDGLPYGLNLGKLLRREPGQSKDSFFCSELVATAYMRVGLIDEATCSASSFYPSSFNQANSATELNLQQGAELGPELLVDFVQPAVLEAVANSSGDEGEGDADEYGVGVGHGGSTHRPDAVRRRPTPPLWSNETTITSARTHTNPTLTPTPHSSTSPRHPNPPPHYPLPLSRMSLPTSPSSAVVSPFTPGTPASSIAPKSFAQCAPIGRDDSPFQSRRGSNHQQEEEEEEEEETSIILHDISRIPSPDENENDNDNDGDPNVDPVEADSTDSAGVSASLPLLSISSPTLSPACSSTGHPTDPPDSNPVSAPSSAAASEPSSRSNSGAYEGNKREEQQETEETTSHQHTTRNEELHACA